MLFSELKEIDTTLEKISGDVESFDISSISNPINPKENTFIFLKANRFYKMIGTHTCEASFSKTGVILEKKYYDSILDGEVFKDLSQKFSWIACVENVNKAMCLLSKPFYDIMYADLNYVVDGRQMGQCDVHVDAQIAQGVFIGEGCKIGKDVQIMSGTVVMPKVEIADGTIIFPNVTIYPYSKIGKNCRIHSSTVVGADGYGYNFFEGKHLKIWHIGGVTIEDEVEIGSATSIDCGAFIDTHIGEGTKIDNSCQISHNAQIGKHCILCGKSGLAGSAEIEDYVALGAHSGLAPGAKLGKGSQVGAQGIVSENSVWGEGVVLAGHPARPLKEHLRGQAKLRMLAKS